MDEELLKRAAVIRDETADSANTAERVGSLFVDALQVVQQNEATAASATADIADLKPKVATLYTQLTDAQATYYVSLSNVYSAVGHLCGSLSSVSVPPLKVTANADGTYTIGLWQDGDTYRGGTIPLATDTTAGVMSAADHTDLTTAIEDIETLFGASATTDKAVAANTADISSHATRLSALEERLAALEAETLLTD